MKERLQDIDDKNDALRDFLATHRRASEFLERFDMSWIFHDNALEGVIYTPQELAAALKPGAARPEASMHPAVLDIRNHKAAVDFIRHEAKASGKKPLVLTLATVRHLHDLFLGNTPEAQAARAATERRERTEKELAKERDRSGFRKDMPLHRTYFHDIAPPAKILPMLEKLLEGTATPEFKDSHPIRQAAIVQHQLLQIFPFTDHSGKVARMASNLFLVKNHYLPCIIHSIDRQKYYEAFRAPAAGFRLLLMEAMENSLDNALKFFREAGRAYRPTP